MFVANGRGRRVDAIQRHHPQRPQTLSAALHLRQKLRRVPHHDMALKRGQHRLQQRDARVVDPQQIGHQTEDHVPPRVRRAPGQHRLRTLIHAFQPALHVFQHRHPGRQRAALFLRGTDLLIQRLRFVVELGQALLVPAERLAQLRHLLVQAVHPLRQLAEAPGQVVRVPLDLLLPRGQSLGLGGQAAVLQREVLLFILQQRRAAGRLEDSALFRFERFPRRGPAIFGALPVRLHFRDVRGAPLLLRGQGPQRVFRRRGALL